MASPARTNGEIPRELESRFAARLDAEITRLREQSRNAVEEFKRTFPPPSDEQIERLLYPELSEFNVELGGRTFILRELPALYEKKFLRLVEKKLPALVAEIFAIEERLAEPAGHAAGMFADILSHAHSAMELIAEACALVLDPDGAEKLTHQFIQQHVSTARQLRILKAQLLLNGARDFLSRLFPAVGNEAPAHGATTPSGPDTQVSPPPQAGSNSSASLPERPPENSPSDNWP